MSQSLPTGGFEKNQEIQEFDKIKGKDGKGYILEVDLEYPSHLHDDHIDNPLAPESVKINKDDLSPYAKEIIEKLGGSCTAKKLLTTLHDKHKYVLHYRNLELYGLSLGLKLKRIHRAIKFNEHPWLKSYIEQSTELRMKAMNDIEKDFSSC